jgi:hypothetical protein
MTTTIPLSELGNSPEPSRLDQWDRYLIVPPTGGKPVGYTRVTTVAKTLDSGGGLADWKASMTASGIIIRKGLRAEWEALLARTQGDPWYAGDSSKAECKRLVTDCAAVGGANDRRQMGSSLHTITALVDLGRTPAHLTTETERDVDAYVNAMAAAGITITPGAVELVTVLDSWQVAGTADRLAVVPGFDLPLIADLKTGANLEYSWQSIAVQLAGYSRGERLYRQGPAKDGSQDTSQPMPPVEQHHGLIIWLKAGEAEVELYLVDLDAGWEAFQLSMRAREWAKRKPQQLYAPATNASGMTIPTTDSNLMAQLEASVAALDESKAHHPSGVIPSGSPQPVDNAAELEADRRLSAQEATKPYWQQYRAWLQERIDLIGQHAQARQGLGKLWPQDIPTPRSGKDLDVDQLAAIEALLDDVERRYELPFGPPKPEAQEEAEVARVLNLFPGSSTQPQTHEPKDIA